MKTKRIYISIPITGREDTIFERNELAKKEVKELGYEYVSPIDNNDVCEEDLKNHTNLEKTAIYMGEDIEDLITCDSIYLCQGWENSRGCQIEKFVAEKFNKEILEQ